MEDSFDPFDEWLDIPSSEQPPHHYRLLGLKVFESNADVIRDAADRRMKYVHSFQLGPRSHQSQAVLNQLAAAKVCLLNPTAKARYDLALEQWFASRLPAVSTGQTSSAAPAELFHQIPRRSPRARGGGWMLLATIVVVTILCAAVVLATRHARTRRAVPPPRDAVPPPESPDTTDSLLAGKTVSVPAHVVRQDDDGNFELSAARARLNTASLQRFDEAITGWSRDATVEWEFLVNKPGYFRVEATYAAGPPSVGGQATIKLSGDRARLTLKVRDTGGPDRFATYPVGAMLRIPRGGRYTLFLMAEIVEGNDLMRLRSLRLRRAPTQ